MSTHSNIVESTKKLISELLNEIHIETKNYPFDSDEYGKRIISLAKLNLSIPNKGNEIISNLRAMIDEERSEFTEYFLNAFEEIGSIKLSNAILESISKIGSMDVITSAQKKRLIASIQTNSQTEISELIANLINDENYSHRSQNSTSDNPGIFSHIHTFKKGKNEDENYNINPFFKLFIKMEDFSKKELLETFRVFQRFYQTKKPTEYDNLIRELSKPHSDKKKIDLITDEINLYTNPPKFSNQDGKVLFNHSGGGMADIHLIYSKDNRVHSITSNTTKSPLISFEGIQNTTHDIKAEASNLVIEHFLTTKKMSLDAFLSSTKNSKEFTLLHKQLGLIKEIKDNDFLYLYSKSNNIVQDLIQHTLNIKIQTDDIKRNHHSIMIFTHHNILLAKNTNTNTLIEYMIDELKINLNKLELFIHLLNDLYSISKKTYIDDQDNGARTLGLKNLLTRVGDINILGTGKNKLFYEIEGPNLNFKDTASISFYEQLSQFLNTLIDADDIILSELFSNQSKRSNFAIFFDLLLFDVDNQLGLNIDRNKLLSSLNRFNSFILSPQLDDSIRSSLKDKELVSKEQIANGAVHYIEFLTEEKIFWQRATGGKVDFDSIIAFLKVKKQEAENGFIDKCLAKIFFKSDKKEFIKIIQEWRKYPNFNLIVIEAISTFSKIQIDTIGLLKVNEIKTLLASIPKNLKDAEDKIDIIKQEIDIIKSAKQSPK